ncbi:MAG: 6-phospho-beta-glucosidase [Actinomycetota bacterium]|nr:6-phospho-beta-glucosidase [Actinomycetota bacterium]
MRLVILGGGGFRVPLVHRELLRRPELGIDELVLADPDADRLAVIARVLTDSPALRVRSTTSIAEAVRGADFVFSAIRVGGAAGRVADERRALNRGVIGQETVGAGGLAYGLRTLPVALEIARTIAETAPAAWLINFTNPAGLISEALRDVLGDRVIGICDSPAGLVRRACRAAGADENEVLPDYLGINHLGWLRGLRRGTEELLPGLLADRSALESFEEGRLFGADLLRALGSIPNEYLYFYYQSVEVLAALATGPTRGEVLLDSQSAFYSEALAEPARAAQLWEATRRSREESYLAEARAEQPRDEQDLSGGGYEQIALQLMHALAGGPPDRLIINVANVNTVPQLPPELVLELPCAVDATGARPLPVSPPDLHQLGLIASVRAAERAAIDAVRNRSRSSALRAFASHPLVGSERIAREILDELLSQDRQLAELLR